MIKLTALFAVAAFGLSGCKKKQDDKAATGSAAIVTGSAASADVPPECNEYKAAIEKLGTCDKLPKQARDQLEQAYAQTAAGWAKLPADARANLASGCKAGTDAVMTAAKQSCGW